MNSGSDSNMLAAVRCLSESEANGLMDGWMEMIERAAIRYLKLQADVCVVVMGESETKPVRNVVLCMQSARDIDCTGGVCLSQRTGQAIVALVTARNCNLPVVRGSSQARQASKQCGWAARSSSEV